MSSSDPRNWPEYVTYGVALILLAAALGVGYSFFVSADANSALDARLCPKQGAPPALLVVMVDTSDPLSIVQRKAVDNRLREAIEQSPDHTEIQLYTVGDITNTLLQPVANVCNPGSGEGTSQWFSNPQLMHKRWQTRFFGPLDAKLDQMLHGSATQDSPIMESIQSVAVGVFGRPELRRIANRKLIIVSDMLQNTAGYSQYHGDESFTRFRNSAYYFKVRPELDGVDVTILYLRRPELRHLQGGRHVEFWRDFFTDVRARPVEVAAVEG